MARKTRASVVLDLFFGRGTTLNRAIVQVLGRWQPQTTRQISKLVQNMPKFKNTSCSTVNKRVRDLEKHGYLKKAQAKERIGGITNYYELTPRAYLAKFLDSNSVEDIFERITDEAALIILASLTNAKEAIESG